MYIYFIHCCTESDEAMDEGDLMVQWFELVNQKNDLVRMETDLMYRQRQQELEDQHEEVEYELRCLMEKPGQCSKTGITHCYSLLFRVGRHEDSDSFIVSLVILEVL